MPTVNQGSSATITVTDGGMVLLNSDRTSVARLEVATGSQAGRVVTVSHAGRRQYGPFTAGTLTLSAIVGSCEYLQTALDDADSFDPTAVWSDSTGAVLIRPDGSQLTAAEILRTRNGGIDPLRFMSARHAWMRSVTITSPYAAASFSALSAYVQAMITADGKQATWEAMTEAQRAYLLHPSLVHIPDGFRGYRYWLAYTPYPNGDASFENPCVVASNDLATWVTPSGYQNPIAPSPAGSAYNADTHLYWYEPERKLVLLWMERDDNAPATTRAVVSVMTEAAVWTTPATIWTGVIGTTGSFASPSIWYNDASAKWEMIGVNVDGGGTWPVNKLTSSSLLSGWDTTPVAVTMPHPVSGRRWWHMSLMRCPTGEIVGVAQDNSGTPGANGFVYLVRSLDGTNFGAKLLSGTVSDNYRPSLAPGFSSAHDVVFVHSGLNSPSLTFYGAKLDQVDGREADAARHAGMLTTTLISPNAALLADNFDRTDASVGANPLGSSSGGQTWTNVSGTDTVGISGNAAYNVTTGNCRAIYDVGSSEYTITLILAATTSETNPLVRWTDSSNYVRLLLTTTPPKLQQVVAGSLTDVTGGSCTGLAMAAGDLVRIDVTPARIRVFVNGTIYCDVANSAHGSAKTCGVQMAGTSTARLRSFVVHRPT